MPHGEAVDSLVEDVQQHLSPLHLHDERDRDETVQWGLAALAEKNMRHLPIMPANHDGGHPARCAAFAGQDDHVPLYFDRPVAGVYWVNDTGDKQLAIAVIGKMVIGGSLHGIVLLGPILASQRSSQAGTKVPCLARRSLGPMYITYRLCAQTSSTFVGLRQFPACP
jgi:hypothetical protein